MPKEDEDPIIVAYSDEEEVDPVIIVAGLEGDEQKDQEEEHIEKTNPLSHPRRRERKFALCYTPRSPPYPPPEDKDWDTENMPELVDIDKGPRHRDSASRSNADKDFFKTQNDRQQSNKNTMVK